MKTLNYIDMSIVCDTVVIGAGPIGLFQIFELGLLGIKTHIIDSLPQPGGQCSELYPDKPIYDIPALPIVGAQELIDRLMEQARPFNPEYHLNQEVTELEKQADGRFRLKTSAGAGFDSATVIIAGGLGSFQPRSLRKPGVERYEGDTINYKVTNPEKFRDKNIIVLGGGDSALDWTLELMKIARRVTLVHRREGFRGAPAMAAQVVELASNGQLDVHLGMIKGIVENEAGDTLTGLEIKNFEDEIIQIEADEILAFYGLSPKLGPIANWGLAIDKNQITVDTETYSTDVPGIFAVGDINTYPGKKKLILSGFHEAALAAFGVQKYLNPDVKQFVQYTTTSPLMHKRLGISDPK